MTVAIAESMTELSQGAAAISVRSAEEFDSHRLTIRDCRPSARWPHRTESAPMPSLSVQGRWLERAGFAIGARVHVRVTRRRLIVEVIESDAPLASQPRQHKS
jgi:hypothetical protein